MKYINAHSAFSTSTTVGNDIDLSSSPTYILTVKPFCYIFQVFSGVSSFAAISIDLAIVTPLIKKGELVLFEITNEGDIDI